MRPFVIFYHLAQIGDHWEELFQSHLERMKPAIDEAENLFVYYNGHTPIKLEKGWANKIPEDYTQYHESGTLLRLYEWCVSNPGHDVLYIHSKGVSQPLEKGSSIDLWTEFMFRQVIDKREEARAALPIYRSAGPNLLRYANFQGKEHRGAHYSGNFWWASADHIRFLDADRLVREPFPDVGLHYSGEFWVLSDGSPGYNLGSTGMNSYYMTEEVLEQNGDWEPRIGCTVMFKNEATVIRRMLDSTLGYFDYYVMQDNGSTDGTADIARAFLEENNLRGYVYEVEEGWVGFGWNRDHVLQKFLSDPEHGCQWVTKMDCDEILIVEDYYNKKQFLQDHTADAYMLKCYTTEDKKQFYYRTWLWAVDRDWHFHNDPCHETIYIEKRHYNESIFPGLCHFGYSEGESYLMPTKYVSDALILEEKMIRENSFFTDPYHFWYIGKSYYDGSGCSSLPLGEEHRKTLANRGIWYFTKFIESWHEKGWDTVELAFWACVFLADLEYTYNSNWKEAAKYYMQAANYCHDRNENWLSLALMARDIKNKYYLEKALSYILDPDRKYKDYYLVYVDSRPYLESNSPIIAELLLSLELIGKDLSIGHDRQQRVFVIDNFYQNPDDVREYALSLEYNSDNNYYKGYRSAVPYYPPGMVELLERTIGRKITNFYGNGANGFFQITTERDPNVFHADSQTWAGILYLTPDAPIESGTSLLRNKITKVSDMSPIFETEEQSIHNPSFLDSTKYEAVATVGNVYNRLVIIHSKCLHAAGNYFGNSLETGRLVQLFFFD